MNLKHKTNKNIVIGNNYYIQRVPEIQYVSIPAIFVQMAEIGGKDYVDYCQLLLDVLKVKEKCKTFKIIEDSQVKKPGREDRTRPGGGRRSGAQ